MNANFLYTLTVIGLGAIGFLISLYYKKKPVNIEKVNVNRNYLAVVFLTQLAATGIFKAVENNIAFFQRINGFLISPSRVVNDIFIVALVMPMVALISIAHWKKRELKKNRDSE
jgi:hypothetical protein